jgi:hypothetical protein
MRRVDARGFDFEATATLAIGANRSGEDLVGISIKKGIEPNFLSEGNPIPQQRLPSASERGWNEILGTMQIRLHLLESFATPTGQRSGVSPALPLAKQNPLTTSTIREREAVEIGTRRIHISRNTETKIARNRLEVPA